MQMTSPSCTVSPTWTLTSLTVYLSWVVTLLTSALPTVPVAEMEFSRLVFCRVVVRMKEGAAPAASALAGGEKTPTEKAAGDGQQDQGDSGPFCAAPPSGPRARKFCQGRCAGRPGPRADLF